MRVLIQVSIAGNADPRYNLEEFSFQPGQIADVDPDLAQAWIASGVALPAAAKAESEPAPAKVAPSSTKRKSGK